MSVENNISDTATPESSPSFQQPRLWTKSFIALLITQFMVSLNDNLFRWLIIPIGKYAVGWSDHPDEIRTIGAVVFLLPFLVLTTYAGYFCDRFDRKKVIVACKIAEVIIILFGILGIVAQSVPFMLIVLFFLGAQSAFFSPAKYSSLPSIVPLPLISKANGYYSLTTLVACVGGQFLGGTLFALTTLTDEGGIPLIGQGGMKDPWIWASALMAVAVIGLISSFFIPKIEAADPKARFPLNPFSQTFTDLRTLFRHRSVFWFAMGSSFFWGLGALGQLNIDKLGTEVLRVPQDITMILLIALTIGLAFGALFAGKFSRGRIEFGMIPVGAFLITAFCLILSLTPHVQVAEGTVASWKTGGYCFATLGLVLLGFSSGMFDLPLVSAIQVQAPAEQRGRIIAAYNFYSFASMLVFSALQLILAATFHLSAVGIWFACGAMTLIVLIFTLKAFFIQMLDFVVRQILSLIYHHRIIDPENVPDEGGALLISNHVSYIDAILIYTSLKRPVRFLSNPDDLPGGWMGKIAKKIGTIPIRPSDRKSVVKAIREARRALSNGELVCIFPEGTLSRTGQMKGFEPGFLSMLKGNENCPVIPVWIGGMWGSFFTEQRMRESKRRVHRLQQRLTVAFGPSIAPVKDKYQAERAVEELGVDSMNPRRFPTDRHLNLPLIEMLYNNRKYKKQKRFSDSTGVSLTGKETLLRILVLRRLLKRILDQDEKNVGLILPTSVAGMLVNAALSLDKRVPINLNFTTGNDTLNYCCELTGMRRIITSKKLLQKMPNLALNTPFLILEDAVKEIKLSDKLIAFLQSLLPTCCLISLFGLKKIQPDDIMTIVFTSGSTGRPKGVLLSHMNVAANVNQFVRQFNPTPEWSIFGALPLFHSFGFSTTIWCPLMSPLRAVYHYSPLDAKIIGQLCQEHQVRILVSTASFFRLYLRRCPPEAFKSVYINMAGAEKLPADLAQAWQEKFGTELVEGFGATELSPVLAGNIPSVLHLDPYHPYMRPGSIGVPLGDLAVRITDPETGEELGANTPGMLEVKGPNVMLGYYKMPEQTAEVLNNGWYKTGDIAKIDDNRFIFITGRESRISKIGGEMVPHIRIEEELAKIITRLNTRKADDLGAAPECVVTAVPDPKKGERIVVLYTSLPISPEEICKELTLAGLPQIWIPFPIDFHQIEAIPILGTGKLSLKEIKDIALKIYAQNEESAQ